MKKLFAVCLLILFSACGVQKRVYNKGFYVSKHEKHSTEKVALSFEDVKQMAKPATLFAQVGKANTPPQEIKKSVFNTDCDTIFFRDGSVRVVKVVRATHRATDFVPCYTQDGEVKFKRVSNRKINYIHYSNTTLINHVDNTPLKPIENISIIGIILTVLAAVLAALSLGGQSTSPIVGFMAIMAAIATVFGFALNLFALIKKRYAKNRPMVIALAIMDFIFSVPLLIGFIIALFIISLNMP